MAEMNELQILRHSASHVMAQAVKRLFPEVKLAIGPAIDNGFYYDFDTSAPFTAEDLEKIEAEMKKIAKENLKIERFELPKDEALELMRDEPYKIELIEALPEGEVISFYTHPDETGRGYGGMIMEEVLRRLKESGFPSCYVYVLRENEGARRFYARHGFAWDGTHEEIPFPPDSVCIDLRYTRKL